MKGTCYCGRTGEVEDWEPVYLRDGECPLTCPDCGHLVDLHWLSRDTRKPMLEESARRRLEGRRLTA
jgi:uncharacterized C2H2 Zn-finger protein